MTEALIDQLVQRLAPDGCMQRAEAEKGYPPRNLASQLITRVAPSPTGFMHVGTLYTALVNERLAHQEGGVFYVRIEDTDKQREVEGGTRLILDSLNSFGIRIDEGPGIGGIYGPYIQSQRTPLYMSYAIDLLRRGRAYPCFATAEQLTANAQEQTMAKVRPGYYGEYAIWRDKPEDEVMAALQAGQSFVLRFRSEGSHQRRIKFHDELKGDIEMPENDIDVPLLKSDGLPTYHLAHVVDDHLMGTSLVLRGEEWLSSVPLHLELAQALEIPAFKYAHIAPISVLDNGNKRKLSKRKDAEADVRHWLAAGYPTLAIVEYLLRLANSNFEDWRKANPQAPYSDFQLTLPKLAMSRAPLLDMKKLDDVSRDVIADMSQADFEAQLTAWVGQYDFELARNFGVDPAYTSRVLTVEREGPNRRKDLAKWSDSRDMYGYFFDELYLANRESAITEELSTYDFMLQKAVTDSFLNGLDLEADQQAWLNHMREAAQKLNFTLDLKAYRNSPQDYAGSLADYAKIIRVRLTAKNRSPDLFLVMQIMGKDRVKARLAM